MRIKAENEDKDSLLTTCGMIVTLPRRSSRFTSLVLMPSYHTSPSVKMQRSSESVSEDLPLPVRPTMPMRSPERIVKESECRTVGPPYKERGGHVNSWDTEGVNVGGRRAETHGRVPRGELLDTEIAARGPVSRGHAICARLGLLLDDHVFLEPLETVSYAQSN